MKITLIKAFKGHSSLNLQSSIWVKIETDQNINDVIQLYCQLQRQSKIIVSDQYTKLSADTFSLNYVYLDCAIKTLEAIQLIFNGEDENLVKSQLAEKLSEFGEIGQNNQYFLNDALKLGIPYNRLSNSVYQFGLGHFTKSFSSTSTKNTSYIGVSVAKNKIQSANLLRFAGFPAPTHIPVLSIDEALEAANKLGYPVVIKPLGNDNGDGVFAGITNSDDLNYFFVESKKYSDTLLIERHQQGTGHRITVFDKMVVSTTKKLPWGITGDGQSTISELLTSTDYEILSMLKDQNLSLQSVLPAGEFIPLRRKNNASANGLTILLDISEVHPDNIKLAFDVAALFNLDIVGVDLIISDISKSWLETECVICDVNSIPQIGFDRVEGIFNSAFKDGIKVPIYLLITKNLENLPLQKLKELTGSNGISSPTGVWINDNLVSNRFSDGFDSARYMVFDSRVERGLVIMTDVGVKNFGLPLQRFNTIFLDEITLDEDLQIIISGQNIISL